MNRKTQWFLIAVLVVAGCGEVVQSDGPDAATGDDADGSVDTPDAAPRADADPLAPDATLPPDATVADVTGLSDNFDGTALDPSWESFQPELFDTRVSGGALNIIPNQHSLWYAASQGGLIFKQATGNVRVTASVQARRAKDPSAPPVLDVHLGGIMARAPANVGDDENYVFIVVGHDENDLSVETKNTVDGTSTYTGPSWPSGDAQLCICRIGNDFTLYKRASGDTTWTLAATFNRPDLPATLQYGPMAYAPATSPDLLVIVDGVSFAPAVDASDCTAD